jgi:hypothetical protein
MVGRSGAGGHAEDASGWNFVQVAVALCLLVLSWGSSTTVKILIGEHGGERGAFGCVLAVVAEPLRDVLAPSTRRGARGPRRLSPSSSIK